MMRNVVVKLLVMTWAHVSMLIRASSCEVLVYGTKNAGSVDIKGLVVRFHRRALGILRCQALSCYGLCLEYPVGSQWHGAYNKIINTNDSDLICRWSDFEDTF